MKTETMKKLTSYNAHRIMYLATYLLNWNKKMAFLVSLV